MDKTHTNPDNIAELVKEITKLIREYSTGTNIEPTAPDYLLYEVAYDGVRFIDNKASYPMPKSDTYSSVVTVYDTRTMQAIIGSSIGTTFVTDKKYFVPVNRVTLYSDDNIGNNDWATNLSFKYCIDLGPGFNKASSIIDFKNSSIEDQLLAPWFQDITISYLKDISKLFYVNAYKNKNLTGEEINDDFIESVLQGRHFYDAGDMESTFVNSSITNVNFIDSAHPKKLYHTFYGCSSLTDISALSNWDVGAVTNLECTFYGCSSLSDLTPLSNWDVSAVTNMLYAFFGCSSLTDISALSNWDVSAVTNMTYTFENCSSLSDISALSNWDVSNVTTLNKTFVGCPSDLDFTVLEPWKEKLTKWETKTEKIFPTGTDPEKLPTWASSTNIY